MSADREYHLRRARSERHIAYRSADDRASNAHMRLSALHLQRALVLEEVDRSLGSNGRGQLPPALSLNSGAPDVLSLIELPLRRQV